MSTKSYIQRYMREEYSSIDSEIRLIGKLLFENARGRVLDFGCGPSLLFWSMFMQKATRIDGFDIVPENIGYLNGLLSLKRKPLIYAKLASNVKNRLLKKKDVGSFQEGFKKIGRLKVGNILKPAPFGKDRYDTVTEIGCIGCVHTNAQLLKAVRNMHASLKDGGTAVFVNWTDKRAPLREEVPQFDGTVRISRRLFEQKFREAGFHDISLSVKRNLSSFEFGTIIYGTARK